ncbi:hypothetical protein BGZ76_006687, partial [Entomortierella beljakovae]
MSSIEGQETLLPQININPVIKVTESEDKVRTANSDKIQPYELINGGMESEGMPSHSPPSQWQEQNTRGQLVDQASPSSATKASERIANILDNSQSGDCIRHDDPEQSGLELCHRYLADPEIHIVKADDDDNDVITGERSDIESAPENHSIPDNYLAPNDGNHHAYNNEGGHRHFFRRHLTGHRNEDKGKYQNSVNLENIDGSGSESHGVRQSFLRHASHFTFRSNKSVSHKSASDAVSMTSTQKRRAILFPKMHSKECAKQAIILQKATEAFHNACDPEKLFNPEISEATMAVTGLALPALWFRKDDKGRRP